jgi:hypothetical protein
MDEKRRQLQITLDETIREIIAYDYPTDPEGEEQLIVAEWLVSVGVMGFIGNSTSNGEVEYIPSEELPLWRAKGLVDGSLNKLRTVESHNFLVDMHADMDGEEEE